MPLQKLPTVRAFAAAATHATAFASVFAKEKELHDLFGVPEDTVRGLLRVAYDIIMRHAAVLHDLCTAAPSCTPVVLGAVTGC